MQQYLESDMLIFIQHFNVYKDSSIVEFLTTLATIYKGGFDKYYQNLLEFDMYFLNEFQNTSNNEFLFVVCNSFKDLAHSLFNFNNYIGNIINAFQLILENSFTLTIINSIITVISVFIHKFYNEQYQDIQPILDSTILYSIKIISKSTQEYNQYHDETEKKYFIFDSLKFFLHVFEVVQDIQAKNQFLDYVYKLLLILSNINDDEDDEDDDELSLRINDFYDIVSSLFVHLSNINMEYFLGVLDKSEEFQLLIGRLLNSESTRLIEFLKALGINDENISILKQNAEEYY